MAQPVWLTKEGNLGTVQEGKFFQFPLQAYDPDNPNDSSSIHYLMLAGDLPEGVQCGDTGLIEGIPKAVSSLQGVPTEIGESVTSKFSVRVYTTNPNGSVASVNDRTFELTVTGQDVPEFVTPAGLLGAYIDGDYVNLTIEFTDDDPDEDVTVSLSAGSLPPGLTLSSTGVITGYITPDTALDGSATPGYDATAWDAYPYDFRSVRISKSYKFSIRISDGKEYRIRSFEIFVYTREGITADSSEQTVDSTYITADVVGKRLPYLTVANSNLGTFKHDNFFAHQFSGGDFDGDAIRYNIQSGDLPPGLNLESETGWLVGYLGNIGLQELSYTFVVRVSKVSDSGLYRDYTFTMSLYGDIDTDVTWITGTNLGTITNGQTSELSIQAVHIQNFPLYYRLKQGSSSKLPRGLKLLESGNIIGRTSYQTFALDSGTTTFDTELRTRLDIDETTFDSEYTFTVEAYNSNEVVNVSRTFTVTVDRLYNKPCQCMRIEAFMPDDDRQLFSGIMGNHDIFKPEWMYRNDDPWHGKSSRIWYEHAYGLNPSTFSDYLDSVLINHYRKRLVLGGIRTARALDSSENVLYEVVYATVVDDLVNNEGESVSKSIKLTHAINEDDSTEIDTVYPNSLDNMREEVIDNIGQVAPILPRWMLSKQEDGTVPGFTRAWVICYTIPGKSEQVAYNFEKAFLRQLNKIDFDADRYVLGWYSAQHYDSTNDEWEESKMTTFDRGDVGAATETTFDGSGTRFIYNIDIHEFTDAYDKYLLFPQRRIIENDE